MPVPTLTRTRSQLLKFDFLVPVCSELLFKYALIHFSPQEFICIS